MAEPVDAPGLGPGPFGGGGSSPLVRTLVPHLVAAPDKFRGTASAAEVAAAAARAAQSAGWSAEEVPLADGGEGTLEILARALGGERRRSAVRGPLGEPVDATWLLLPDGRGEVASRISALLRGRDGEEAARELPRAGPVAVVESALVAGRALVPAPRGDDPVRAGTDGVGDLILAASGAGARLVVVGSGGTATTDGGAGALSALGSADRLGGAALVVACDVATPFRSAAETFAPQKGATPAQVAVLRGRLDALAARYRDTFGVDVDRVEGTGAGGGLAGGLAAIGARLVPGFSLVAALVDLDRRAASANLLVTGEGQLDATSFAGKVVGGVLDAAGGVPPALCVAGQIEPGVGRHWAERTGPVEAVSLAATFGSARARRTTTGLVFELVATACRRRSPPAAHPLASHR